MGLNWVRFWIPRRHLAMLRTLIVMTVRGVGASDIYWVEAMDAKNPTRHRTVPSYPAQNVHETQWCCYWPNLVTLQWTRWWVRSINGRENRKLKGHREERHHHYHLRGNWRRRGNEAAGAKQTSFPAESKLPQSRRAKYIYGKQYVLGRKGANKEVFLKGPSHCSAWEKDHLYYARKYIP